MNAADRSWLETLTNLPTIAGHEDRVVAFVRAWTGRRPDLRLRPDAAGNLHVTQKRRSRRAPLLVTAHLDHPGFLVTGGSGRQRDVEFRGGVRPPYFDDARLHFFAPGSAEPAPARLVEFDPALSIGSLRLTGRSLEAGAIGRWAFSRRALGVRNGLLHAAGCDDLAGVAAALSFIDRARSDPNLGHVGVLLTRAEEVGFVGAIAACREGSIPEDARLICLETSRAFPESPIGAGPVIRVGDRVSVFSPELTNRVSAIAEEHGSGFRWQRKLMAGGACEATAFSAFGFESTCICLPLGNYHNQGNLADVESGGGPAVARPEVISLDDHAGLIRLLGLVARHLDDPGAGMRTRLEARFDPSVVERRIP